MDLLIDARGRCQQRCAVHLPCAIWRKGFIHIRKEKRGIVVSLSPDRVKGPTVAGAVYTIADISPETVSLIVEKSNSVAIVFEANWKAACKLICKLVAEGRRTEEEPTEASRQDVEPLTEPEMLDDPENIIAAALEQHERYNPASLTRVILEQLWEAGYDVRPNRY